MGKENKNEIKQPAAKEEIVFTKEQLISSDLFSDSRDILSASLEDNIKYTKNDVNKIIENFKKGKVK